jgi:hypothetical protein
MNKIISTISVRHHSPKKAKNFQPQKIHKNYRPKYPTKMKYCHVVVPMFFLLHFAILLLMIGQSAGSVGSLLLGNPCFRGCKPSSVDVERPDCVPDPDSKYAPKPPMACRQPKISVRHGRGGEESEE